MSVIVKGMRLPDCCGSCPLLEYDEFAIDGNKDHWCNVLDIGMSIDEMPEGRREDCPLTELIRCRDCKYYDGHYCHNKWWGDGYGDYTSPIKSKDGFCDWAERRGEHDTAD